MYILSEHANVVNPHFLLRNIVLIVSELFHLLQLSCLDFRWIRRQGNLGWHPTEQIDCLRFKFLLANLPTNKTDSKL